MEDSISIQELYRHGFVYDADGNLELITRGGECPICPSCYHFNALLDEIDFSETRVERFKCRDCGFTIEKEKTIVVVMKLDKPGMGHMSTYHILRKLNGTDF